MHAACLERSPRLQRVHALLSDGVERLTLGISRSASVCAVNSGIAQLRVNGRSNGRSLRTPGSSVGRS